MLGRHSYQSYDTCRSNADTCAGPSPNYSSGWGRVNLTESIYTVMASCYAEGVPLEDDDSHEFSIEIKDEGASLKATLVWTDRPGSMLQNDLDLTIRAGDQTHVGNTGLNRTNNLEQIVWQKIPQGTAKVRISARSLTRGPQSYAVAWKVFL